MRGFLSKDVAQEQKLEQQARAIPDSTRLRQYLEAIAAQPHHAGSPGSRAVAERILAMFHEWGLDARIEEFEALMPYPTVRKVEVIGPKPYVAKLKEPMLPQDPTSGQSTQLPTYNAYGASGDVTGEVVYANFGVPDDYDWLDKQGISVKGKIVITRYGKSWRGIKPKVAAEHGAIACLIYSDPHEDGYFEADTYPNGPMRSPDGVQRGSVLDMPLYSGDPLSPGWASEKGSRRLAIADAKSLVKIPVLPLSYSDVIRTQAAAKRLDPALIAAVIYAETKFDPRPSAAGAEGLMQILPQTAEFLARRSGGFDFRVSDLATPDVNIAYGSYYLRYLLDRYDQSKVLALAAYNAGETNVDRWVAEDHASGRTFTIARIPYPETRAYVGKVLVTEGRYRKTYPSELGYG